MGDIQKTTTHQTLAEAAPDNAQYMTRGGLLARNTVLNYFGQGALLIVGFFAIPFLIKGLGTDRFGILTLVWMVIGYFSLFDLGMGRAMTMLVSEKLGAGYAQEIPTLVWTSLFLMLVLGLAGGVFVGLLSPWLVHNVLKIPDELQVETLHALYLLALSIPIVIISTGLRGILEAHQRFDLTNGVRIFVGFFTFLSPFLALHFSQSLFPVVGVLVAGRFISWLINLLLCLYVVPTLRRGVTLQREAIRPLIRFGSWMTVTNVVGPFMVYLDRFLIGALVSVTAVAYYATPYEIVTKLWLIAGGLVSVLFPAFSTSFVQDLNRTALLFVRSVKYVFLALFPITLVIVTLAHEGLDIWLGSEFAQNSTRVLQWIAVGVFINSLAQVAFALIQGAKRPDITAKLHLLELPFYLITFWWLINAKGIEGAAIAWVARVTVDTFCLFGLAYRLILNNVSIILSNLLTLGSAFLILALGSLLSDPVMKGLFLTLTLLSFALAAWFIILVPDERAFIGNRFKSIKVLRSTLKK